MTATLPERRLMLFFVTPSLSEGVHLTWHFERDPRRCGDRRKPGTSEGITGLAPQPPHTEAGEGVGDAPLLSSLAPRVPGKALHQGQASWKWNIFKWVKKL